MSAFVRLTESRTGRALYLAIAHIVTVDQIKTDEGALLTRIKTASQSAEWVTESPTEVIALLGGRTVTPPGDHR